MPTTITEAQLCVELNCDCPNCSEYVNLIDCAGFWDGDVVELAEIMTKKTDTVTCPECGDEFLATFICEAG